jgi:hypothetical protein
MLELDDLQALQEAVQRLENPSFAVELAHFIGMPVKRILKVLPRNMVLARNRSARLPSRRHSTSR